MNPTVRDSRRCLKLRGFTLLEVLITIVIVALGLLGLGALQVRAMRDTTSTYLRSQAIILTQDMADRIRANLPFVRATSSPYTLTPKEFGTLAQPTSLCQKEACTIDNIATADLWQWRESVRMRLPGGQGEISISSCVDASGNKSEPCTTASIRTWTITVHWDERRDGSTGITCPAGSSDLACMQVRVQP